MPFPQLFGLTSALISFLRTLVFQVAAVLIFPMIWGVDGTLISQVPNDLGGEGVVVHVQKEKRGQIFIFLTAGSLAKLDLADEDKNEAYLNEAYFGLELSSLDVVGIIGLIPPVANRFANQENNTYNKKFYYNEPHLQLTYLTIF